MTGMTSYHSLLQRMKTACTLERLSSQVPTTIRQLLPPNNMTQRITFFPQTFYLLGGSTVKLNVEFYPYKNESSNSVALRLRAVQVIKYVPLADRSPFDAVDDGFTRGWGVELQPKPNPPQMNCFQRHLLLRRRKQRLSVLVMMCLRNPR